MTKREEIEKVLARELRDLKHRSYDSLLAAQWILRILHSQGVVIKSDNQTIEVIGQGEAGILGKVLPFHITNLGHPDIVRVEPLIKDDK